MESTDRIVIVASGFGLWRGGRHAGSARWSDVSRIQATVDRTSAEPGVLVRVALDTGMVLDLVDTLPGWAGFLAAAADRLPGMPRLAAWLPALLAPTSAEAERVLFERKSRTR